MGIKKNGFLIFGRAQVYNFLECSIQNTITNVMQLIMTFFLQMLYFNNVRKVRNSNYAEM